MTRTLITLGIVVGALAIAWVVRRFRSAHPTAPTHSVPTHLNRWDFAHPNTDWLLAVFTSDTCSTCDEVAEAAAALADESLAVQNLEYRRHDEIHLRYAISAVPLVVLADRDGTVRASLAGPATPTQLSDLIATARSRTDI